jgi:gamma-glutamylcyclotransferase (GGCT)/AIG2-like uncharacterized protein YtfP
MKKYLVSVYGSLRESMGNHNAYLNNKESKLLGSFKTEPNYTLFSLGSFPGLKKNGKNQVTLEVYEVEETVLENLDYLESYDQENEKSSLYLREIINTPFGESYIYFYNGEQGNKKTIESGDWVQYKESLEIN